MRSLTFVVPGRLDTPTGGYEYDRRMIDGLRTRGWHISVRELDPTFPHPTRAALDDAATQLSVLEDDALVIVDGLAFGAMPDEAIAEARRLRLVALVHMPLAFASGLSFEDAARLEAGERRALGAASFAIATGRLTAGTLSDYGVDVRRLAVIEPGTERARLAEGSRSCLNHSRTDAPVELLCVATVTTGKGQQDVIRALAALGDSEWHLSCVGSLERDPAAVERLRALIKELRLEARVSLCGVQYDRALDESWDRADAFVLATYGETYGMAVAEAIAHGLPVVSTRTGAIPEIVGSAAVLVTAGDIEALTRALARVLDRDERAHLAAAARQAREQLPTWDMAFDTMTTVLDTVRSRD